TGPENSSEYFRQIDQFIGITLGAVAQSRYRVIVNDPLAVAQQVKKGIREVRRYRKETDDAYYFNWRLRIDADFQTPFLPNHENMRALVLNRDLPSHLLAANLRRAFSGVVAGNVKDEGIRAIERHGHFEIRGERMIMERMDDLLTSFVAQSRMKLSGKDYTPCYRIIR
ncbi:MAG: DUF3412 domain-containing protein, partial [Gammaproteobacteria bacterium]|nr:DUF3412 domain-containing protein [Gammaproteobacteria bacterium]